MIRILAIPAGVVNVICMFLALLAGDMQTFLTAYAGAGFAFYGWLYFHEEARGNGQTPMGYRSLAMRLRWDIKEEGRAAGSRLPTVKQLAEQHGTTRTTVMRALKILAEEGLVEIVRSRGTYVVGDGGFRGERTDRPKDRIEWHLLNRVQRAASGDPMPSTGELMAMYQASHVTVRRVQAQLAKQGLIRRTRTGAYVKA